MEGHAPPGRVLAIALDMGDGPLIQHWSRRGRLPHLAALAASGGWLDLESTAAALHTSVWPTFATGTLPGRHGVYYPYQPTPGQQLARHIGPDQYGVSTFWGLADGAGRRCVVYDIPETFPEPRFRGRAVFDWGTWAWYGEPTAQPSSVMREIRSRFGNYPLGFEAKRLGFGRPDDIETRLLRSVEYKAASARWLLDADPWDLAAIGFCETHPAGHYLWPEGVDRIDLDNEARFEPLYHVYAAVDRAIGLLRQNLPSDTLLMVISGDGVRPNRCAWHLLPAALERLGYLTTRGGAQPPRRAALRQIVQARAIAAVKRQVAAALPWRVRDRVGMWLQARAIDWPRTRAFALPTDLEGCIRVNVKGREPFGIVHPGAEYDEVCQEIRSRFEELVNPVTGAAAVQRVWIRNEVFPGRRQEELPDVIVTWNDEAPLTALQSPRLGLVEGVNTDPRPGTHSTRGFLLAAGSRIQAGVCGSARLTDVAPTILQWLGVPPRDMDGTLLEWRADSPGFAAAGADAGPGSSR